MVRLYFNDENKATKELCQGRMGSPGSFSVFMLASSAHFNSWGTTSHLVEAGSGPYLSELYLVPPVICSCYLEEEEIISKSIAKIVGHQ